MKDHYRRVTVVLDEQLTRLVDQHAQQRRVSRSAVVRSAVASYLIGTDTRADFRRIAESGEWSRALLETIIDISAPGKRDELAAAVHARMSRYHGGR